MVEFSIRPDRVALLNVDLQNFFVEIVENNREGLLNKGTATAALYAGLTIDPRDVL